MSTLLPLYINVNVNGIPTLRSLSVTVGAASVAFDFNNHRNVGRPFRGLLIVDLAQIIPAGTTVTVADVPSSEGYTFAGWYTDSGLTKSFSFSTKITAGITLYAKWTENSQSGGNTPGENDPVTPPTPGVKSYDVTFMSTGGISMYQIQVKSNGALIVFPYNGVTDENNVSGTFSYIVKE